MNYIELAHRTSAPVGPARERLNSNHVLLSALFFRLGELAIICKELDTLKRVIFYGQEFQPDRRNMPTECEDSARHGLRDDAIVELLHAGLGIATEGGEFLQALSDHLFEGLKLDKVNLSEEVGDTQWYLAKACRSLGTTLEKEQNLNITKLAVRYGSKFGDAAALLRDLDAERSALEQDSKPKGELAPSLKMLASYLDSRTITPETIGNIRHELMLPIDCDWNVLVRDETAKREKKSD